MRYVFPLFFAFLFGQFARAQTFAELVNETATEDLAALHEQFGIPRGDVDVDGSTDFGDFLAVIANYGEAGSNLVYGHGDLNRDATIGLADLALVLKNFGFQEFLPDPASRPPLGNLGLSKTESGFFTVSSGAPVAITAMEIVTPTRQLFGFETLLIADTQASPFAVRSHPNPRQLVWFGFGEESAVVLDGDFPTSVTSPAEDLEVRWVEKGSYDVYSLPIGVGDSLTGRLTPGAEPATPAFNLQPLSLAEDLDALLLAHRTNDIARGELDSFDAVGVDDLEILTTNWGSETSGYLGGDLNLDGEIGFDDFAILSTNFGNASWVEESGGGEQPSNLTISFSDIGRLIVASDEPIDLAGIEIQFVEGAPRGVLESSPFGQPLFERTSGSTGVFAFGDPESPVKIDDEVTFSELRLEPGVESELIVRWFAPGSSVVFESDSVSLLFETPNALGDADMDGTVSFGDYLLLQASFGSQVQPFSGADFTGDGLVDFADFLVLSKSFGQAVPAAATVPEPNLAWSFAFACIYLLRRSSSKVRR